MKQLSIIAMAFLATLGMTGCKNANFKTTPGGLKYKIYDGGSKDSTKTGDVLKANVEQIISGAKDTTVQSTYGKMPAFIPISDMPPANSNQPAYDPGEVVRLLKKGDSAVVVMLVDSLIKKGLAVEAQLPPFMKKGDKIIMTFKVLEVFKNDSLARLDFQKEMEKDAPRQRKEQEEQMEKMRKELEDQQKADDAAIEKSGEKAKQIAVVENYLKSKGINTIKTPLGSYVKVDNPGTGAQVTDGKFVTVKYIGKKVLSDSTFEGPNSFTMEIGKGGAIRGFEDGLRQFKQGGKGVVYIPGYLAYGKNPPPGSPFKAYEPLYFEVEITNVSDTEPQPEPVAPPAPQRK